MANKSGVAEQILSLPKGGGALQGLGETFQPDEHTGTGNLSIPIQVPGGRNKVRLDLALQYSTGSENGPFGLGWQLSVPQISRKSARGIPQYQDDHPDPAQRDTFLLSGWEDLVLIGEVMAGAEIHREYRPRTEGQFARIRHIAGGGKNHWEVLSRDGLRSVYGEDPACRVFNGAQPDQIFAWLLQYTEDPYANRVTYSYRRETGRKADGTTLVAEGYWYEAGHDYNQVYLSEIAYLNYRPQGEGTDRYLYRVAFDYGEFDAEGEASGEWSYRADDPFSTYTAGFEIRTVRRCRRILITMSDPETAEPLVKAYELTYAAAEHNKVSLLTAVTVRGFTPKEAGDVSGTTLPDGTEIVGRYRSLRYPPMEFGYTRFDPTRRGLTTMTAAGGQLPEMGLGHAEYELIDLEGYGLPGVLHTGRNGYRYWRNLGGGRFDRPHPMHRAPNGITLADAGVTLADMDGNGTTDLLVSDRALSGYYPTTFPGEWDPDSFQPYDRAPGFDLSDRNAVLVDMNGDGITDLLYTDPQDFQIYYNRGKAGWDPVVHHVARGALDQFPDVDFASGGARVRLAAMAGSMASDIAVIYDGRIDYWPHMGYGNYGRRITMRNTPRFGHSFDPERLILADVDGDGYSDLIYVESGKLTVCINQAGNNWSDPVVIHGTPMVDDHDAIRAVDLMGTGTSGILWSYDWAEHPGRNYLFLDLTGSIKPYLLSSMQNNRGVTQRVSYQPSTWFYLQDRGQGLAWQSTLPFPVQCIHRVEVIDQLLRSKLTSEYTYHHGCWDGVEREFRGFGRVDRRDSESREAFNGPGLNPAAPFDPVVAERFAPPTEVRTWFHQGAGPWTGAETDFSAEYWSGDPQELIRPAAIVSALVSLPPEGQQAAYRTLRRRKLRQEVYGLDGSDRAAQPYTVTEYLHGVAERFAPAAGEVWRRRVFFSFTLAERTTEWERGTEPRTRISFTDQYDSYGLPGRTTLIAVPRGRQYTVADPLATEPYIATVTVTGYARRDDAARYIVDRVAHRTSSEVLNDGKGSLFDLYASVQAGTASLRVTGQTLHYYDGPAYTGLTAGQVGDFGALVRTESLVLTDEIVQAAYSTAPVAGAPPMLSPVGAAAWPASYPEGFRDALLSSGADPTRPGLQVTPAGYGFTAAGPGGLPGYYAATERRCYDFQAGAGPVRGLVKLYRSPVGQETLVEYDRFGFLPESLTDPAGLVTRVEHDYRAQRPAHVTDANGSRTAYSYTPLGLLGSVAVTGAAGEGDTAAEPGVVYTYDLNAFSDRGDPLSVRTRRRFYHAADPAAPPGLPSLEEVIAFSDGFGRLLQRRSRAEATIYVDPDPAFGDAGLPADQGLSPGDAVGTTVAAGASPHVVVSGWQEYDNKGRVIGRYEPFFDTGWAYKPPTAAQLRSRTLLEYDPLGRIARTAFPDGSEQRMVYGVPTVLASPDLYTPTPWENYAYDRNDNAGRTHAPSAVAYSSHWDTPASIVQDALGRTISAVARNGSAPSDWYTTRYTHDSLSNLIRVVDAKGRTALECVYDLTGRRLRQVQLDAGVRCQVAGADGSELARYTSKGSQVLRSYDHLGRPVRLWARDSGPESMTLREHLIYGDSAEAGLPASQAAGRYLLGRLYRHYDEAGLATFDAYDFKGNPTVKLRRAISDEAILSIFSAPPASGSISPYRVDWQPADGTSLSSHANGLLEGRTYRTTFAYDARNRVRTLGYPQRGTDPAKQGAYEYNLAGELERVTVDGTTYVERIAYNPLGQRLLAAYGSGLMTRYAYGPESLRLVRLRTERFTAPAAGLYQPAGGVLQDLGYTYDLIGNPLHLREQAPSTGLPAQPDGLERRFTYDPLYRLLTATGRECDTPAPARPWEDTFRCHDTTQARAYDETYTYDETGSLTSLRHDWGSGAYLRSYGSVPGSDRLQSVSVGTEVYAYAYDANGNLARENSSRHFEWDHADRLRLFRVQTAGAVPTVYACYLYDAAGRRTKSLVRKGASRVEVTLHLDGLYEEHRLVTGNTTRENSTLHVMDDERRVATLRLGAPFPGDTSPAVQYHLADHLGSSSLVVDDTGAWTNREEYTPYGETSFGGFALKRYRYAGKQRDNQSGLYDHGARWYAPWLGRWASVEPVLADLPVRAQPSGEEEGRSAANEVPDLQQLLAYGFAACNPIRYQDPNGRIPVETVADVADVGWSAYDMWTDPGWLNAGFLVWSVVAVFVPYMPGAWVAKVGKVAFRGLKYAGKLADLTQYEAKIAKWLGKKGDDIIGLGDKGVRETLDLPDSSRAADFLSVTEGGKFNITEVKESVGKAGADIDHALSQIETTVDALNRKVPDAKLGELTIAVPKGGNLKGNYVTRGDQLVRVTQEGDEVVRIGGKVVHVREVP